MLIQTLSAANTCRHATAFARSAAVVNVAVHQFLKLCYIVACRSDTSAESFTKLHDASAAALTKIHVAK